MKGGNGMFESICKSILIICAALLSVPCHAADLKALVVAPQERELEEARQKIAALQTQLADRGKVISMSLAASASEAATARMAAEKERGAANRLREENVFLKTENERLGKVIAEKNAALDGAIKLLSSLKPKSASIPKIAGEEYVEEALGPVVVERSDGKVIVAIAGGAEQKADARFFGAVTEKRRSEDGRVVYTLDPLRLKQQ
jgi:hypothetical protein